MVEAEKILSQLIDQRHKVTIKHFPFTHNEIRSDDVEEIAREAAIAAYSICKKPVFVEDTGLFIDSLNGFPGTFSAWVLKKIGTKGILKLVGKQNRTASFITAIAYHNGTQIHIFKGVCEGSIAETERGTSGFGYDPIFVPKGHENTFAEGIDLKNKLSHRYKSLLAFSEFLNTRSHGD